MSKKYTVTRKQIVDAALSMRGWKFQHQGRGENNATDCVGLLVIIGQIIEYPFLTDAEAYRRTPSADTIRTVLQANCDEIPAAEVGRGSFFLMKMGGAKPRHASVCISTETDLEKGLQPSIIHALPQGVVIEPISNYPKSWYVAGFRVRGLAEDK